MPLFSPTTSQSGPAEKNCGRRVSAFFTLLLLAGASCTTVGCSGYIPLWLKTPELDPGAPHFSGAWTGRWEHTASGQGGPVQSLVPANPSEDGTYPVRFRAGWKGVFWGRYTAPTKIALTAPGEARSLTEKDLGPRQGGTYSLEATITPKSFTGTFRSRAGDLGTVKMERP